MEVWKAIEGYDNYEVSNYGNVRSKLSNHYFQGYINWCGYRRVNLRCNGKKKWFMVHRLVAQAFLDNPYNLPQVNHKNEIKTDNRVENLEWCTAQYNLNYGTVKQRRAVKYYKPILQYDLDNNLIREWPSIKEASLSLHILDSSISCCLIGRYKTAGGYKWQYKSGT